MHGIYHSLMPSPHAPPSKKQPGEQNQISWAYSQNFSLHSLRYPYLFGVGASQERALAQEIQLGSPDSYFPCERVGSKTSMSVTHRILGMRRTHNNSTPPVYVAGLLLLLTSVISKHPMAGLQSTRGTRLTRAEMSMPDTCSSRTTRTSKFRRVL